MGKKQQRQPTSPEDAMLLDIGLGEEDVQKAVEQGLGQGIKGGVKKGAREGMKPLVEEATKRAIQDIGSGGGSPMKSALEDVSEALRMQALQETIRSMKQKPAPEPPQQKNPAQDILQTFGMLQQLGVDPSQLTGQLSPGMLLAVINPQLAPLMIMAERQKKNGGEGGGGEQLMTMLMMMMQQQGQQRDVPPAPVQSEGTNQLVATLLAQQSEMQKTMMQLQQERQELQQQNLLESLRPLMQRPPSFAEQVAELKEKMSAMGMGEMGGSGPRSDFQAELDHKTRILAMELEKEKMKMEREMALERERIASKERERETQEKILNTAMNALKNFKIELPARSSAPPAAPAGDPAVSAPPREPQKPLSSKISERITGMLRSNLVREVGE